MSHRFSVGFALLVSLGMSGCSDPPRLNGVVQDAWGQAVEGATVQLDGLVDKQTTDARGRFSFPAQEGTMRLLAGKEGFIRAIFQIEGSTDPESPMAEAQVKLFPDPPQPGFFAVKRDAYDHLAAAEVRTVGTEIRAYTGIKDVGEHLLSSTRPLRVVFSSTARSSELKQLALQLHRLRFVDNEVVPGVLGDETVTVNLWLAEDTVQFDLTGLQSEDDYLLTTREPLAPGVYAFHTQDVLTSRDADALDKLPREMRVAFPFEVK